MEFFKKGKKGRIIGFKKAGEVRESTIGKEWKDKENAGILDIAKSYEGLKGHWKAKSEFSQQSALTLLRNTEINLSSVKSLDTCIENLCFRNRNLVEVLRIRQDEISKKAIDARETLNKKILELSSELDTLNAQKNGLIDKTKELAGDKMLRLILENHQYTEKIEQLKFSIKRIIHTTAPLEDSENLRAFSTLLEKQEDFYLKDNAELKSSLSALRLSNSRSSLVATFLQTSRSLADIYSTIRQLKAIILNKLFQQPLSLTYLNSLSACEPDSRQLIKLIYSESRSLRSLITDKYAEIFTDSCQNQ